MIQHILQLGHRLSNTSTMEVKPGDLLKDKLRMCPIEHSGKPLPLALVKETRALVLQKLMDASACVTRLLMRFNLIVHKHHVGTRHCLYGHMLTKIHPFSFTFFPCNRFPLL